MQGGHGSQHVRAVDGSQAVARLQARYFDPCAFHGFGARESFPFIKGFPFAQKQQRHLRHGREVSRRTHRSLLTNNRCDAFVKHLHQRLGDLGPAPRIAVGVDVDPASHGGAYVFDRRRVANSRRMIIDEVLLKFLYLFFREDFFRELADTGVRAIHNLFIGKFFLQHGATDLDAFQCVGAQLDFLVIACNCSEFFDRKSRTVEGDGH